MEKSTIKPIRSWYGKAFNNEKNQFVLRANSIKDIPMFYEIKP